jgi:hypothetical protein
MGRLRRLARLDDLDHLIAILDVAGVETDLVNTRLHCLERPLKMKVHIGDDRHLHLRDDVPKRLGVLLLGNRDAHDVRTRRGELVNLTHARIDVVGIPRRHRLDAHRRRRSRVAVAVGQAPANGDPADTIISDNDLPGWSAWLHAWNEGRDRTRWTKSRRDWPIGEQARQNLTGKQNPPLHPPPGPPGAATRILKGRILRNE